MKLLCTLFFTIRISIHAKNCEFKANVLTFTSICCYVYKLPFSFNLLVSQRLYRSCSTINSIFLSLCHIESHEEPCNVLVRRLPREPPGPDAALAVDGVPLGADALLQPGLDQLGVVEGDVWKRMLF